MYGKEDKSPARGRKPYLLGFVTSVQSVKKISPLQGDGNVFHNSFIIGWFGKEDKSPARGRKLLHNSHFIRHISKEDKSPARGRKLSQ